MWSTPCKRSFKRLKRSSLSGPTLRHFDLERNIIVKTDTSNLVVAEVLSQYDDDDILLPVTYFSRMQSPAKSNYEIHDKELLAIIWAFKEWCPRLTGSPHTIKVISDHRNLTYFTTNRLSNYGQI
jgi:hypothetical protein